MKSITWDKDKLPVPLFKQDFWEASRDNVPIEWDREGHKRYLMPHQVTNALHLWLDYLDWCKQTGEPMPPGVDHVKWEDTTVQQSSPEAT